MQFLELQPNRNRDSPVFHRRLHRPSTLVSGYRVQMLDDNDVHVERFYEIDCRLIGFHISEGVRDGGHVTLF